jgi:uncharacterized protein YegL
MTNPDYTALLFIIDESGSMYGIARDMEGGIETILEEQAKLPGKLTVDVAYFDGDFRYPTSMVAAAEADIKIIPQGSTSLHDAIVRASTQFGKTLSDLPEDERPGNVIVTIVTDGFENSSTESTKSDVKELITKQQDEFNWSFLFLGANQDAVLTGESFGLRKGASMTYNATSAGTVDAATITAGTITSARIKGGPATFLNV